MQSSGFLSAKSIGTPLPSRKAAVQTLFEFSQAPKGQGAKPAKCSDGPQVVPKPPAAQPRACPPSCKDAVDQDTSKAARSWRQLVIKSASREEDATKAARRWLKLIELKSRRQQVEESEQAKRVPNKWLVLCNLQTKRDASRQHVARQWLKLAVAESDRNRATEKREAEQLAARSAAEAWHAAGKGRGATDQPFFSISGAWDDWVPHEMSYSHSHQCYHFTAELRGDSPGAFKVSAGGHREIPMCLEEEAEQMPHGQEANFYSIRLHVGSGGDDLSVEKCKLGRFSPSPARSYWIAGTWDDWAAHEMAWNPGRSCFSFELKLGAAAKENFRILVHGKAHLAWYPDVRDATCHAGHIMYGPDGAAHGRSWTIGKHPLDRAAEGACYQVRLRLRPDGSPLDVDWVPVQGDAGSSAATSARAGWQAATAAALSYGRRFAEQQGPTEASAEDAHATPGADAEGRSECHMACRPIRAELERALAAAEAGEPGLRTAETCWDSDGEEVTLCQHCSLPMGDLGYAAPDGQGKLVHGECLARLVMEDMQRQDELRLEQDAAWKKAKRSEYDIGWKAERIPSSIPVARRLQCSPLPQGMCCLVLDPDSNTVRPASTVEPAAAVNLEYLSLALLIRLREGREPFFSLDPIKGTNYIPYPTSKMQAKRFAPEWLAGTSVGEVLFQADYHLKELSMGEYEQPVLGMMNCRQFSEHDEASRDWSGREWFVIRKAEVQVSDDNVLVPDLKMGVEARAQVLGQFGLEDAKITLPDHPLVKYAEAFTNNFDLIAERKSVFFNLRELAKATVLAKYLVEARVPLDDSWFNLADDELKPCITQIPQLWNERLYSQINVENGQISTVDKGIDSRLHGVYGGVDFGLDRMQLAAMAPLLPTAPRAEAIMVSRGPAPTAFSMIGGGLPTGRAAMAPTVRAATAPTVRAQGVDLDLGKIDLSSLGRFHGVLLSDAQSPCASAMPGSAFWSAISKDSASELQEDWRKLLRDIFNPAMSDRRSEGGRFIPPRTCPSYVSGLRTLVKGEDILRRKREEHFLSTSFALEDAGNLFPSSWKSSIDIAHGKASPKESGVLLPCSDYKGEMSVLQQVMKPTLLAFDRSTEDGCNFRVYKLGPIEVRTTQPFDGEELVGAVFSIQASTHLSKNGLNSHHMVLEDHIIKATQYVECRRTHTTGPIHAREPKSRLPLAAAHYYTVLETQQGSLISTERLDDGRLTFDCNPKDLVDRNSAAKVVHSTECRAGSMKVGELKQQLQPCYNSLCTSASRCKKYARAVCRLVDGHLQRGAGQGKCTTR